MILSYAVKVVVLDWERIYGGSPIPFESFVDSERFSVVVYKASNWIYLGKTKGKGRRGLDYFFHGRIHHYYLYPMKNKR